MGVAAVGDATTGVADDPPVAQAATSIAISAIATNEAGRDRANDTEPSGWRTACWGCLARTDEPPLEDDDAEVEGHADERDRHERGEHQRDVEQ